MSCFLSRVLLLLAIDCALALGQSNLERAVVLARERRYAEAQQVLRTAQEPTQTAQRIAFHRLKAAVAAGVGDSIGAAAEMRQALQLAPDDLALLLAAAVAELQAGELGDGLDHAQRAGDTAQAKAVLGDIHEARGSFEDAVKPYGEAVRLDPSNEKYPITLALELIRHHRYPAAINLLNQVASKFPASARILTLRGIAQYASSETEASVASLTSAIALDPADPAAYQCLAQIVLRSAAAPNPVAMTDLCRWNATVCSALKLRIAREKDDAVMQREAIAALRRAPQTDIVARCELARAWEWGDRLPEARTEMEACIRADPSPHNHYRLGLIYRRMGFSELAKQEMEARAKLLQDDSEDSVAGLSALKAVQSASRP